jgi:hypothetical protein
MRRVSPSVMAREQLQGLLVGAADRESNIVSALVETVTRLVVQELLEGEQQDFLGGRGRYDRRGEGRGEGRAGLPLVAWRHRQMRRGDVRDTAQVR